jgi:hypothetical protein
MSDSRPAPPQLIPLGSTQRPEAHAMVPPAQVRSPQDLPNRFFIGDLDRATFSSDDGGWRATYASTIPDTFIELRYGSTNHQFEIDASWRGSRFGPSFIPGRDWSQLSETLSLAFQAWDWDDVESALLVSRFNVHYASSTASTRLRTDEPLPVLFGMPDGILKVLFVPIAVDRLRRVIDCIRAIDADPKAASGVQAYAVLSTSVVNYLESRCPGLPLLSQTALARHAISQLQSPVALPVREGPASDGSYAHTLRRSHYTLLVNCTFRDIEHVAAHLFDHELIGGVPGKNPPERYPWAPEYAAIVVPAGAEMVLEEQTWWDAEQTRRTVYGRILKPELLPRVVESANAGPDEVLSGIESVEFWRDSTLPNLFAILDRPAQ